MASIQKKGDSWYCQFMYRSQRRTMTIGEVDEGEARATAAKVAYLLMRIKQNLLDVPVGMDIVTFLQFDGKPPDTDRHPTPREMPFCEIRDSFLKTFGNGAVEENTLSTARVHLKHIADTLGERFPLITLTLADLQRHVEKRRKKVAGVTIRKEIDTLRSAWNWAARMSYVEGDFPSNGLVYPKDDEKLPFMTWKEIERRIKAGGDPKDLWECLYLGIGEVASWLTFMESRPAPAWLYPACCFAAHTGVRRSEIIRARVEDVDLAEGIVTVREKKRVRGVRTTRRVPLSTKLTEVLRDWMGKREGKPCLFSVGAEPLAPQTMQKAFVRAVKGSKWSVMKGWHVLRHTFISALASRGVDQRLIDGFVGHQTEEQRRRYRHLYPSTQEAAIKMVFG
jgi:integrase